MGRMCCLPSCPMRSLLSCLMMMAVVTVAGMNLCRLFQLFWHLGRHNLALWRGSLILIATVVSASRFCVVDMAGLMVQFVACGFGAARKVGMTLIAVSRRLEWRALVF